MDVQNSSRLDTEYLCLIKIEGLQPIPVFQTIAVYQVVNQTVALLSAEGFEINNSTTSIMSILLFAVIIHYLYSLVIAKS